MSDRDVKEIRDAVIAAASQRPRFATIECAFAVDPLDELLFALTAEGKPSLEWVVRWSVGDAEPVAAAWAATKSDVAMRQLLFLACVPGVLDERGNFDARLFGGDCCQDSYFIDGCATCRAAIRTRHPTPPTLAELLNAVAAERSLHIVAIDGSIP